MLASLAVGTVLLAAFLITEARTASPLVPLRLMAQRARCGVYSIVVCTGTAMFGVFFFLTLFLQRVWGYSPLHTSILYVPPALLLTVGGPVASRIVPKTGRKPLVCVALAIAAIGMIGMSRIGEHSSSVPALLAWTYFGYAGLGLISVPLIATALDRVPPGDTGVASGVYSMFRQLGGATGLAVLGTVAWSVVAASITRVHHGWSFGDPHTPAAVIRQAMTAGADRAFLAAAIVIIVAFVIALLTINGGRGEDAENLQKRRIRLCGTRSSPRRPALAAEFYARGWWRRQTFLDDLAHAAATRPAQPAVIGYEDGKLARIVSYAELATMVARFAGALTELGAARGDVVVLYLPNRWMLAPLYLACARIGAVAAPVLPALGGRELGHVLRVSQARICVSVGSAGGVSYAQRLAQAAPDTLEHQVIVDGPGAPGTIDFGEFFLWRHWEERDQTGQGPALLGPTTRRCWCSPRVPPASPRAWCTPRTRCTRPASPCRWRSG